MLSLRRRGRPLNSNDLLAVANYFHLCFCNQNVTHCLSFVNENERICKHRPEKHPEMDRFCTMCTVFCAPKPRRRGSIRQNSGKNCNNCDKNCNNSVAMQGIKASRKPRDGLCRIGWGVFSPSFPGRRTRFSILIYIIPHFLRTINIWNVWKSGDFPIYFYALVL